MNKPGIFAKHVAVTFFARGVTTLSGVAIMVAAARLLGPVGKGEYSYLMTLIGLGVQFGNMGVGTANLYFSSLDPRSMGKLLATSASVAAVGGGAYFVVLAILSVSGSRFVPFELAAVLLIATAVAAALFWAITQNLLVGVGEVLRYNSLAIVYGLLMLGGMLVSFQLFQGELGSIVVVQLACAAVVTAAVLVHVINDRTLSPELDKTLTVKVLRYGISVYVSQAIAFLLIKCDLLMVQYYLDPRDLGLYSLAGDFSQAIVQLQAVVNMLLFPRLVTLVSDRERRRATRRILVRAALVYLIVLVAVITGIEPFVEIVFGAEFVAATSAVTWLLPGAVALALASIFQNHIGASGRSIEMVVAPAVALVVNVVLCVSLVPRYGITGAAVSSSLAFGVMFAVAGMKVFRRY